MAEVRRTIQTDLNVLANEHDDDVTPVTVTWEYWPSYPGNREQPPEEAELEVQRVVDIASGVELNLEGGLYERVEQALWDWMARQPPEDDIDEPED